MPPEPIFQDQYGWWFWDEVWTDKFGPYHNQQTAKKAMERYFAHLSGINGHSTRGLYIRLMERQNGEDGPNS
jgi:hypothetical protein